MSSAYFLRCWLLVVYGLEKTLDIAVLITGRYSDYHPFNPAILGLLDCTTLVVITVALCLKEGK